MQGARLRTCTDVNSTGNSARHFSPPVPALEGGKTLLLSTEGLSSWVPLMSLLQVLSELGVEKNMCYIF